MTPDQSRQELGLFFRSRRDRHRPDEVGLPPGERRRVRGLRRDEVAVLSGVSLSWYTWLEQGRRINPSGRSLRRICATLRLSDDEREYVSLLTGQDVREPRQQPDRTTSVPLHEVEDALNAFVTAPAILCNTRFDALAANSAARVITPGISNGTNWERNLIWRFFMDKERRNLYADGIDDPGFRNLIEALRLNWADRKNGDSIIELVDEIRTRSAEFDAIWKERRVARLAIVPGRIRPHPSLPPLRIQYGRFQVPTMPGHAIAVLIPSSSNDAVILRRHMDRMA